MIDLSSSMCINGNTVTEYGFNCEETTKNLASVTEEENNAMRAVVTHLEKAIRHQDPLESGQKYCHTIYPSSRGRLTQAMNLACSSHQVGQYAVDINGNEYSIASLDQPLPFNWVRYFVFGDRVAYVNQDESVHLFPRKCLKAEQETFVSDVEKELKNL